MATLHLKELFCRTQADWGTPDDLIIEVAGNPEPEIDLWENESKSLESKQYDFDSSISVRVYDSDLVFDDKPDSQSVPALEVESGYLTFEKNGGKWELHYSVVAREEGIDPDPDQDYFDSPDDDRDDGRDDYIEPPQCPEGPGYVGDPFMGCPPGILEVQVVTSEGHAVSGASVALPAAGLTGITGADGWVEFDEVPSGTYLVEARRVRFTPEPDYTQAEVAAAERRTATLILDPIDIAIVSPLHLQKIAITDEQHVTKQPEEGSRPDATRYLMVDVLASFEESGTIQVNGVVADPLAVGKYRALIESRPGPLHLRATSDLGDVDEIDVTLFEIQIVRPVDNDQFDITAAPQMPDIQAEARVVGINPDPTPVTTWRWELEIGGYYPTRPPRAGTWKTYLEVYRGASTGSDRWSPNFGTTIIGGWCRIRVWAEIEGVEAQSDFRWCDIWGTNPGQAAVIAEIDRIDAARPAPNGMADTLKAIFCHESAHGLRAGSAAVIQFAAAARRGEPVDQRAPSAAAAGSPPGAPPRTRRPLFGPPAGIGIVQRDPAVFPSEHWDWRANIAVGIDIYYSKWGFPAAAQRNEQSRLDQNRQEAIAVVRAVTGNAAYTFPRHVVPAMGAAEAARSRIKGYNGGIQYRYDMNVEVAADGTSAQVVGTGTWLETPYQNLADNAGQITRAGNNYPWTEYQYNLGVAGVAPNSNYVNMVTNCDNNHV